MPCHENLLHSALTCPPSASARRLKLRHPLVLTAYATHQNIWQQKCVALGGTLMEGRLHGWTTLRDSVLSSPTPTPKLREWTSQEQRGSDLTASAPVSDVSALLTQMRYCFLCDLWVWRRRTNRRRYCPPMSNPLTSSWTARPAILDDETFEWLLNTCPEI